MALKLYERYPQLWESPSNDYPQGAFKNLSAQGETDGSYLEKDWLNDYSGFFGALLRNAQMTPNGTVDTAQRSQFYDALVQVAKSAVDLSAYRKKDDLLFKGMLKVQATDDVGTGVFLQDTDGTVRGQVVATDQGLQLTQYPEDGGSQTFTFPSEGGELVIDSSLSYVTPEMFGAVGDGITDDTQAVQKALDRLEELGGGVLSGINGKTYVIRNTLVPSNVVVKDMIINQLVESEPLGQWQLIKHIFRIRDVRNVTFINLTIDGKRGEQNLDNAGTQDGGCVAFDIGRGSRNIKIINCNVTHMATDALQIYGHTSEEDPTDGPYDILVSGCSFSHSRRNNVSVISVEGLRIENTQLDKSGLEVGGTQSGKYPIKLPSGSYWDAPSIDFEPEARCRIYDVCVENCSVTGSRSGVLIYSADGKINPVIVNITFKDITFKNIITGKSFTIEGSLHRTENINIKDIHGYGTSSFNISGGDHVFVNNVKNYSIEGSMYPNSFSEEGTQNSILYVGKPSDLTLSNISIGDFGLNAWRYDWSPSDLINLTFDSTCYVSTKQNGATSDLLVFSNTQTPQLTPGVFSVSDERNLPIFENEYGNAIYRPVFKHEGGGGFINIELDLLGWYPSRSGVKVTGSGGGKWNTTKISMEDVSPTDVGLSIAVKYDDGRTYKGVVRGVDVINNVWEVYPKLTNGDIREGTDVYFIEYKPMYPMFRQDTIDKLSTNATLVEAVAKVNQIIDTLKSSNTIS